MPIEFRCAKCNRLLRTPDETAGKRAKCPQCGTILTIPATGAAPPPPAEGAALPPIPPAPSGVPPIAAAAPAPQVRADAAGRVPLDLNDVFSTTWQIFKSQVGSYILLALIFYAVNAVCASVIMAGVLMLTGARSAALGILCILAGFLALVLLGAWIHIGIFRICLKMARGQPFVLGEVFIRGPQFVPSIATYILFMLMISIGFSLCVVPGVILAAMFFPCYFLVLEHNLSVGDAFGQAKAITDGNKMNIFLIALVAWLVAGAINSFTCGLGGLVTTPFLWLMVTIMYMRLSGQPVTVPQPPAGRIV